jgi:hypothetical protein
MANLCASNYQKVVAMWVEMVEGTATYEENGQKYYRYNTLERIKASELIMAYGFGKPVQPLTGAFSEQRHQILEVRWLPPDPADRSKLIGPEPD